jgi:hypothetical protein
MKAPGDKAELNFKNRLSGIIGKELSTEEKNVLIDTMKLFNTVHNNYFSDSLLKKIETSTVIVKDVRKVGAESINATYNNKTFKQTRKSDVVVTCFFPDKREFEFGISYKSGNARTIQSWTKVDIWKIIFNDTALTNITNILSQITKKNNERRQVSDVSAKGDFTPGSTIHLGPLTESFRSKYKKDLRHVSSDKDDDILQGIFDDYIEEEELKYKLTKYVNKYFREHKKALHQVLFGFKEDQCLFYCNERKICKKNDPPLPKYRNLMDLFTLEEHTTEVNAGSKSKFYYCGIGDEVCAVEYMINKVNVSPAYILPVNTTSNNSAEFLCTWKPRDNLEKPVHVKNANDIIENGQFHSVLDSPPLKNFNTMLLAYSNKENPIVIFQNIRLKSKKSKNTVSFPKEFSEIIDNDDLDVRTKIQALFRIFFNMFGSSIDQILYPNFEKRKEFSITVMEILKRYKTDGQLSKVLKYLNYCLLLIQDYGKDEAYTISFPFELKQTKGYIRGFEDTILNPANVTQSAMNIVSQNDMSIISNTRGNSHPKPHVPSSQDYYSDYSDYLDHTEYQITPSMIHILQNIRGDSNRSETYQQEGPFYG